MDIKPIKSQGDYKRALRAIEQLWDVKPDTARERPLGPSASSSKRSSGSTILSRRPIRLRPSSTAWKAAADPERSRAVHRQSGAGLRGDGKAPPADLAHDPPPRRGTGDPH